MKRWADSARRASSGVLASKSKTKRRSALASSFFGEGEAGQHEGHKYRSEYMPTEGTAIHGRSFPVELILNR